MFSSIFTSEFTVTEFIISIIAAMVLGFVVSLYYMFRNNYSKSLVASLVLLPAIEAVVIMMVNDNFGAGIAVAGSFSLIRFRSAKGSAKELVCIFMAMAIGIICGTGYITIAAIFTVIVCLIGVILTLTGFGKLNGKNRYLKVTVPENIDYEQAIEPVLKKYCASYELESVKTLTLGSLFRAEYSIVLKDEGSIKKMIDAIRTRNGNLEIVCGKEGTEKSLGNMSSK